MLAAGTYHGATSTNRSDAHHGRGWTMLEKGLMQFASEVMEKGH